MKNQDAIDTVTKSLGRLYEALESGRNDIFERQLVLFAKFHKYSFNNVMMICEQFPEATIVAGYHAWKKLGRWVNAGESGIAIFAPMVSSKAKASDDSKTQTEDIDNSPVVAGFRIVYIFDILQTDGMPLIEQPPVLGNPGLNLDAMMRVYRGLKIKVEFARLPGGVQGYSLGGEVRIREGLDDSALFRVLAHELAHELLHKTIPTTLDRKPLVETEAESVAFVVSSACGIECLDRSADYIALHQGNAILLGESLARIHRTATTIIAQIESHVASMVPQTLHAA